MDEVWKPCYRYQDVYVVSNHGRVAKILPNGERELLNSCYRNCYDQIMISLQACSVSHEYSVCVLVVHAHMNVVWEDAFYVRHIDGNKENNRVDNLEPAQSRVNHPEENLMWGERRWRTRWVNRRQQ